MSPDCENKPFWSFGHSREIVGSSIFRYHEWVLTLNFGQTLKSVVCEYIFSKLHSSQGMFAGNVHKTIHTGQTQLNRYRHFLVVLLSRGVTHDCVTTAFIFSNGTPHASLAL